MVINNSLILNSLKSCSMQCLYIFSLFWKKYDKIVCWSYSTLITFILFYYKIYFWRRQWQPTPVLLPGKSHGRRSLVGCSPWGPEESDMTEQLHFHFSLSCTGEGNGNPLQCSCLKNPRDGGAWWAAVYGVAQNRTWLKRLSSSSSILFSSIDNYLVSQQKLIFANFFKLKFRTCVRVVYMTLHLLVTQLKQWSTHGQSCFTYPIYFLPPILSESKSKTSNNFTQKYFYTYSQNIMYELLKNKI